MPKSAEDIGKYEKFLNERLRPDYFQAIEQREKIIGEVREYEELLVTISTMQKIRKESPADRLKARVNLGKNFFVNAVADHNERIVIKLLDGLFAELPLERAATFVEGKIRLLAERAGQMDQMASRIRAHIDLVLSSLEDYERITPKETTR